MKINQDLVFDFIKRSLAEDIGDGDHTSLSTIPVEQKGVAELLIKEDGILAGIDIAVHIFSAVDDKLSVTILKQDGERVSVGDIVLRVEGSTQSILQAERLVLNLMQRMSGIATLTSRITQSISSTGAKLLDTRKTTPGMRYFEKLAVKIGGGVNHRFGLYDMILIKDNHVDYAGSISKALDAAYNYLQNKNLTIQVEIEVRNEQELAEVIGYGKVDRILLDNFTPERMAEAVKLVAGRFVLEASGGITEGNILAYAQTGVDYISMGALTHSVKSLDMSLKAVK